MRVFHKHAVGAEKESSASQREPLVTDQSLAWSLMKCCWYRTSAQWVWVHHQTHGLDGRHTVCRQLQFFLTPVSYLVVSQCWCYFHLCHRYHKPQKMMAIQSQNCTSSLSWRGGHCSTHSSIFLILCCSDRSHWMAFQIGRKKEKLIM